MRTSKQRDAIFEVLRSSYDHPTADIVHERVREKIPNISLGTVYRDLKQLQDSGLITIVDGSDSKVHYEGHLEEHLHFFCESCGTITDVFCKPQIPDELKKLEEKGFSIYGNKTVYYGICNNCRSKDDNKSCRQ